MFAHIKQGQQYIADLIKSDITNNPDLKLALNSGKRIRSLIVKGAGCGNELILAMEYIHTGILITRDISLDNGTRRGTLSIHKIHGIQRANSLSTALIIKGLRLTGSLAEIVSFKLEKLMENRLSSHLSPREVIANLECESLFGIAFILGYGSDTAYIGDALGICYYLSSSNIHALERNDTIDLFTEKMKTVVSELTGKKLWNPILRDIVSYIIKRFEKRLL